MAQHSSNIAPPAFDLKLGSDGQSEGTTLAAVDLGSNSFHLVIARLTAGQLQVLDRLREPVRLAEGLDDARQITGAAQKRGLECLARFGQRLKGLPPEDVRAVGTNTLRRAKDTRGFLRKAQAALGFPIEVLPGAEEARLIYLGVAHDLADDSGRRLVIDIGGGSTELVIGERFKPLIAESLSMGCVSYSERYFDGGRLSLRAFERAGLAARGELVTLQQRFQALGFQDAVGSSGTANALEAILEGEGWSERGITRRGLERLEQRLIEAGDMAQVSLKGLTEDRRAVLPGGLAILLAAFRVLGLESMRTSAQALREGLLYDLLGRIHHHDIRDQTIAQLAERYHVDRPQANRVAETAEHLLAQCGNAFGLEVERTGQFLTWAARLHEIGLAIRHSGYHKHGAYLLENSDLPGFSADDQRFLALLVRSHRRKLTANQFAEAAPLHARQGLHMAVLLRLAVLLNRDRGATPLPTLGLTAGRSQLRLRFPDGWLLDHPLALADLGEESALLDAIGFRLEFR